MLSNSLAKLVLEHIKMMKGVEKAYKALPP